MDPNETAQKLLNQDPFHEVKRKRDRKKENTGYRASVDTRIQIVQQWEKSQASQRGYLRNPVPGHKLEFRIVRDNRMNEKANKDVKPESLQNLASGSEHAASNALEKSSTGFLTDQKQSDARNSEEQMVTQGLNGQCDSGPGYTKGVKSTSNDSQQLFKGVQVTASNLTTMVQRRVENDFEMVFPTLASTNSVIGMSSSSSDPVHVPSLDLRAAGKVGAIRREVGVVGVRRQSTDHPAIKSSISSSSASSPLLKDNGSSIALSGRFVTTSKSSQFIESSSLEPIMSTISKSISSGQSNGKLHHLPMSYQKATQFNMEWKPKPSPKPTIVSAGINETAASSACANASTGSNQAEVAGLSEKLSKVKFEDEHVIIPQHLQVLESERRELIFGSFEAGFDCTKGLSSALQSHGNAKVSSDETSVSLSTSAQVGSSKDASVAKAGLVDSQLGTSQSHSPASAGEEQLLPGNKATLSPSDSYADIGLVQSNSPSYSSSEPQLGNNPSMPSFTAYDPQTQYDLPFLTAIDDNIQGQDTASDAEVHSLHPTDSTQTSTATMVQQQQPIQPHAAQPYTQVHISHFPNFMPYRPVFSPVYVPPTAMPNYSSNAAYPHPPNGGNYLVMPGGNSHITANGLKYATSQYKPVPAGNPNGYGNYANPSGFTISAPGIVGSTSGLDEASRLKYNKDNSSYAPNPQAETSDIWIQTPREFPNFQSAPFYNFSGQAAAPHATYLPTHTGHASFNPAAQTSHVQYPGLYPSPQPAAPMASIPSPHPLLHQQGHPGMGGNVGVGVAAPVAQVGTYQQPLLSHLGWTANF